MINVKNIKNPRGDLSGCNVLIFVGTNIRIPVKIGKSRDRGFPKTKSHSNVRHFGRGIKGIRFSDCLGSATT